MILRTMATALLLGAATLLALLVCIGRPVLAAENDLFAAAAPPTEASNENAQPAAGEEPHKAPAAAGEAPHANEHEHKHVLEEGLAAKRKNPLEWRGDLAIWTFLVFLAVLIILWRTAWKPILAGLQKREEMIAENIAAAQRQNEEAKRVLEQYDRKLAGAAGQVREMLEEARRDAQHTQQEILAHAREEAQTEKKRALVEIGTAKQQAMKELAEEGANLAVDLAGKIIREKLNPADHRKLVQEALGRFTQTGPN